MPKVARVQHWGPVGGEAAELGPAAVRNPQYYAFLSYSHRDEAVAKWLHASLERFRVPSALAGRLTENGVVPKRLTPIFRDRGELAAADDLGTEIRQALAASRFLIVLCSPAAAQSRWTNAEIDLFKKVRPEGCVLAAIVDGEPFASDSPERASEECLPPALRYKYDRRGRRTERRAEPLAADLRGNRDGRRLGFLKIVAGMLGVGLDELVQRETLRRQRRWAILAAASLAGMAVASTLAVVAIQARDEARDQRREAEGLVGFMLGDLRSKLEPLGRLDVLDAVGSRALGYYENQDKGSLSDDSLAQRSKALTLMGEIANTRGDLDRALRLYREALAGTAEALRREPDRTQRIFNHAQNVFWVGYIAWQRGDLRSAERAFRQYKGLADRMIAIEPNQPRWQLERMYAESNLGVVMIDERRFGAAADVFERSVESAESLAASAPANTSFRTELIEALGWLATARAHQGRFEDAITQRERQTELLKPLLTAHPEDTVYMRQALAAERALGLLFVERGDSATGLSHARNAVRYADLLIGTEPANTEWLEQSAAAQLDLGTVLRLSGDLASAAAAVRSGCGMTQRLIAKDRTVRAWNEELRLACLTERARLALASKAPSEALGLAREAAALAQSSRGETAADAAIARAQTQRILGDALAASGRLGEARAAWLKAISAWPKGVELEPDYFAEQGYLFQRLGNLVGAARFANRLDAIGYRHPEFTKWRNALRSA